MEDSYTNAPKFQEFEIQPRMLKDFLSDETLDFSCKSTAQISPSKSTVLLRSRSKRAAVSALHRAVNLVRFFQYAARKSPLTLPRSFSRKSSAANYGVHEDSGAKIVKVKDILRWRSFRDLVEEDEIKPLDLPSSPMNTIPTTIDSSSSCSKKTSWCDSDFSAEEYEGVEEPFVEEKHFVGQRSTLKNLKGDLLQLEESAQQSPVSVLDSPFREYSVSSFHPRVSNIKRARCMLMQRIEDPEADSNARKSPDLYYKTDLNQEKRLANEAEEKAMKLLMESSLARFEKTREEERLLFDFFVTELSKNTGKFLDAYKFDREILGLAKSWLSGDYEESYEWGVEKNRVAYVRDMEKELTWKNFKQEDEEIMKGLEMNLLNDLLDELLHEVGC